MFCTQCGKSTVDGALFCGYCGISIAEAVQPLQVSRVAPSPTQPIPSQNIPVVAQVRPWVRYWARMFDIYSAAIVGGIAVVIFNPDAFNEKGSDQLFALAVIFAWVFIESLFLSTTGTTPGKWLFRIRLIARSGQKPDYSTAISRSFKVWWRGLGIGFPLASLITLILAHGKLMKNGTTTWDRDDGFTVLHERIGPLRVIIAATFFVGFLLLVALGNATNA